MRLWLLTVLLVIHVVIQGFSKPAHAQAVTQTSAGEEDASASDAVPPRMPVTGGNGSYTNSIAIDVPAFRGLEPHLRLDYDSTRSIRNMTATGGELGVGWVLQGVSAIQRVSGTPAPNSGQDKAPSGRGEPAYGAAGFAADSFVLDGTELIPCGEIAAPAATPSCITGGTHSSRLESYLRVRLDRGANIWEVTSRNGVRSVYTSLENSLTDRTYRWHLATVVDLRGNHVDYRWSCDKGHCTIANIRAFTTGSSPSAVEVVFNSEIRPDPLTYGDGVKLRAMSQRITSIQIKNAGLVSVVR